MSLATPSSSTGTVFSPHSLRRFASRDTLHRPTSSPSQNQGFRRSTSGCSEGLTSASAMASVGGGAAQTKAEEKPLSNPTQVVDMMSGQAERLVDPPATATRLSPLRPQDRPKSPFQKIEADLSDE
ncbi:hypothetical protein BGZ89_008148 [Linnemannia elongata]|nr:hypothetical protein BGZ89_008148 [Linnemannia elongata]